MTHNDIVKELSEKSGKTQKETRKIIKALTGIIAREVDHDKVVRIPGLGSFQSHIFDERLNFNPGDKRHYMIPRKRTVHFAAGSTLKGELPLNPIDHD